MHSHSCVHVNGLADRKIVLCCMLLLYQIVIDSVRQHMLDQVIDVNVHKEKRQRQDIMNLHVRA